MGTKRFFFILLLILITLFASYSSIPAIPITSVPQRDPIPTFVWDSYNPSTFPEIVRTQTIPLEGNDSIYLSMEMHRSRVQAVYTGESRAVSEGRLALISSWFDANQADSRYKKLLTTEWLFRADGEEYWLPVLATSADVMLYEFEEGDRVTLLVVLLGASKSQNGIDWLFIVNEVLPE
jgi:hypothetical protein